MRGRRLRWPEPPRLIVGRGGERRLKQGARVEEAAQIEGERRARWAEQTGPREETQRSVAAGAREVAEAAREGEEIAETPEERRRGSGGAVGAEGGPRRGMEAGVAQEKERRRRAEGEAVRETPAGQAEEEWSEGQAAVRRSRAEVGAEVEAERPARSEEREAQRTEARGGADMVRFRAAEDGEERRRRVDWVR